MQYLNQDNPAEWPTAKEQIEYARPKIFDFDYPFFDENKKAEFETQFIKHFFMYDLGLETPALWEFRLDEVMNLIMPYYNQLYESTLLTIEPLRNYVMDETFTREVNDENNATNNIDTTATNTRDTTTAVTGSETAKKTGDDSTEYNTTTTTQSTSERTLTSTDNKSELYSDTPQGVLADLDYATALNNTNDSLNQSDDTTQNGSDKKTGTDTVTYNSTNAIEKSSDETGKVTDNGNATKLEKLASLGKKLETFTSNKSGIMGNYSPADLLIKYRETFLNVTKMIFEDQAVRDLFLYVFN